ncbi:HpcH/HpaI aldolase family protein [Orrella daihaiensis]|uniref:2,4-dihydroxyhept-2-ene-1,7-dioic acid aldolase n=1 Tax=Orrella daihaiensis TaxID=2782176 RepID=A0ABY4AJQ1_9BURK|nr:aldolase/citrate lyase family protein [Orrella daihaiensis]UOD49282.1 2,4-dihydroxyhept-2-ene-1,7-dioic acid aldolase [Orrella daihaiensis]
MRPNTVKERLLKGESIVNGWLGIPSSLSAEILGLSGFDSVTVDLQHGMIAFDAALPMLQALSATAAVPLVRVPSNNGPQIMSLLDAGAYGVICPMISTADQAAAFVSACRYPPKGDRSFGPSRAILYAGDDYYQHANDTILTLAMIETQQGLDHLDEILAVDGLDGIFIGPNDLSLALGQAPSSEPRADVVVKAIAHILARAQVHGKIPGIFCSSGEAAAMRLEQGFKFVVPGNDANILKQAAVAAVQIARSQGTGKTGGSGY